MGVVYYNRSLSQSSFSRALRSGEETRFPPKSKHNMQLGSLSLLLLLIGFFSCYPLVLGASEENAHSDSVSTESPNGCRASATTVSAVVNASNNYMLDSIIVNCLAFSDNTSVVSFGIVSHRQGNTSARSTVICVNEILVVASSPNGFNDNETSCYQCQDMPDLSSCPNNAGLFPVYVLFFFLPVGIY